MREKENTCIAWNSNREMIFHKLNIAQTTRKTLYQQSIQEWWCWVGPGVAQCCDIFFISPTSRSPSKDAIESSLLRTLHWTWCAWDSDCVATSGFFLYISIIIRSRLYGIKMQHPVVELKLLTRESWRMKISSFLFLRFREIAWFAFEFWACASLH